MEEEHGPMRLDVGRAKGLQSVIRHPKPKVFPTRELRLFDLLAIYSPINFLIHKERMIMPTSYAVFGLKQFIYVKQMLAHCLAHNKFSVFANIN